MAVIFTHLMMFSGAGALSYHTRSASFVQASLHVGGCQWLSNEFMDCIDTLVNNLIAFISGSVLALYLVRFLALQVGYRI
jgi:hypothetical protein